MGWPRTGSSASGSSACVGCNMASNRIWRRQGGRCFLINVDLLIARGSSRVALENLSALGTQVLRSCRTQGGLKFGFVLVRKRSLQDFAACSLQLFQYLVPVRRRFSYQDE